MVLHSLIPAFVDTVRELSNHAAEIWAMRQLGDEIYARPSCGLGGQSSSCGGAAWLQEQLGTSYAPAWFDQLAKPNGADAAIAQAGTAGRWLNYYIEGLRHSVAHAPYINGIYYVRSHSIYIPCNAFSLYHYSNNTPSLRYHNTACD